MLLSLVIPLIKDFDTATQAEMDIKSFFKKFQLSGELIWVVDPHRRFRAFTAEQKAWCEVDSKDWPEGFHRKVLVNKKRIGRGPSIGRGLDEASGDFICVLSADLSVPLSEVFAALRLFLNDPDRNIDIVLGERSEKKRQGIDGRSSRRKVFDAAELEKAKSLIHYQHSPDPISPFFMIRRDLWKKLSPQVKLRSWYYTSRILQAALEEKAQLHSISVVNSRSQRSHQRWWESSFT